MHTPDKQQQPATPGSDEDLKTENPISEKDEVKQAEEKTGNAVKTGPEKHDTDTAKQVNNK